MPGMATSSSLALTFVHKQGQVASGRVRFWVGRSVPGQVAPMPMVLSGVVSGAFLKPLYVMRRKGLLLCFRCLCENLGLLHHA